MSSKAALGIEALLELFIPSEYADGIPTFPKGKGFYWFP